MIRRVGLFLGDCLVLMAMVSAGLAAHGRPVVLEDVLTVAFPFQLSWVLVVWVLGFQRTATRFRDVVRAWVVAFPLGLSLRIILGREVPLAFALVTFVTHGLAMVLWRSVIARWLCRLR